MFCPLHQNEAIWASSRSTVPFKIKMYAGVVTVVSGEHSEEDPATQGRRISLRRQGQAIQDYIVVPDQPSVEGIAMKPGVVRQFVAMPLVQGYTARPQLTGKEVKGGLQLEIASAKRESKLVSFHSLPPRLHTDPLQSR